MPFADKLPVLIIILVIVLIIFGPRRLPELGSSLGQALKGFKQSVNQDEKEETPELEKEKVTKES